MISSPARSIAAVPSLNISKYSPSESGNAEGFAMISVMTKRASPAGGSVEVVDVEDGTSIVVVVAVSPALHAAKVFRGSPLKG